MKINFNKILNFYRHDDETNSKMGDEDEEIRSTKDEDRPSSSGNFLKFNLFYN